LVFETFFLEILHSFFWPHKWTWHSRCSGLRVDGDWRRKRREEAGCEDVGGTGHRPLHQLYQGPSSLIGFLPS